tara:strand:+ start:363 stop:956 length:594 start_codon:yes stop_codon:yes gene_type:complete
MAKKIVRITESDLVNIVKRVINEVGGHDDFFQMKFHGESTLNGLYRITDDISNLLDKIITMLRKKNIPKHKTVSTIAKMSNVLEIIENNLEKIIGEIMGNDDLRKAVSDLRIRVKKGRNKLSAFGSYTPMFVNPEMPGGLTGAGLEMGNYELNKILLDILTDIATKALELKSEVDTENKNISVRTSRSGDLDNYNLN